MGKHVVFLAVVLFSLLASLALTLVGILTDYWYSVSTTGNVNKTFQSEWNYHYGMWKRCYDDFPIDVLMSERSETLGDCLFIYKDLIKRDEDKLDSEDLMYQHLSRSFVAFAIVCGTVQLATILTLICGMWPANCVNIKKPRLYMTAAMLLLLACICGIVSGICFIALRDLDEDTYKMYPEGVEHNYSWSFMLHWISTGVCLVESCILLCLVKESYDDVAEKFSYFNMY